MSKRAAALAARIAAAETAARDARRAAWLALRPPVMPADQAGEWAALAERFASDPPSWSPSSRYISLMRDYCAEQCRLRGYDVQLQSVVHEVYREPSGSGAVRAKVNPFVGLRATSVKRLRELEDKLELSPQAARKAKVSRFDAA